MRSDICCIMHTRPGGCPFAALANFGGAAGASGAVGGASLFRHMKMITPITILSNCIALLRHFNDCCGDIFAAVNQNGGGFYGIVINRATFGIRRRCAVVRRCIARSGCKKGRCFH